MPSSDEQMIGSKITATICSDCRKVSCWQGETYEKQEIVSTFEIPFYEHAKTALERECWWQCCQRM